MAATAKMTSFWQSINILVLKPHLINKRLWGCNLLRKYICAVTDDCNWESELHDLNLKNCHEVDDFLDRLFDKTKLKLLNKNTIIGEQSKLVEVLLIELLPKNFTDDHGYQLVCLKKDLKTATFYDVTPKQYTQNLCPNFTYSFQLLNDDIIVHGTSDFNCKSQQWLLRKVLPQIIRWMDQDLITKSNKSISLKDSLSLVPNDQYYSKYNNLKQKYGKEMVKIWPETTDPTKFVFEDVAIATYLLLLWDETNLVTPIKSFVDVGCGNGLLVYILTKEGHKGLGVDVRKRKIWDMYGHDIKLEERTVTPENIRTFTGFDWIIGNHSDELTPWIPVIAARSSYSGNFFLLPCCAYNFDGTKYQRQNSSKSQYTEYLEYIYKLCDSCGFDTEIDRLKIPSTKRICLVGRTRKYNEDQYDTYIKNILEIVNNSVKHEKKNIEKNIVNDFKPRNPVEKVKNCTQVEKSVVDTIIKSVTNFLLDGCNFNNEWTPGKEVCIVELIALIPQKTLKILKAECGGLQTLLKNNHHIFKVQKGKVQLKHPKSIEETMETVKVKGKKNHSVRVQIKPCWFYDNHPQGCPLTETNCSFLHGIS